MTSKRETTHQRARAPPNPDGDRILRNRERVRAGRCGKDVGGGKKEKNMYWGFEKGKKDITSQGHISRSSEMVWLVGIDVTEA